MELLFVLTTGSTVLSVGFLLFFFSSSSYPLCEIERKANKITSCRVCGCRKDGLVGAVFLWSLAALADYRDGLCAGLSVPSLFIHPSETNYIQTTAAAAAELTVEKMSI